MGGTVELRNLTPHVLTLMLGPGDGPVVTLPPSGIVPRRAVIRREAGTVAGLPVTVEALGPVEGLPAPEDGVGLIVSRLVAEAVPERADVFAPGEAVRDGAGRIIGARGLCRVVPDTVEEVWAQGCADPGEAAIEAYGAPYDRFSAYPPSDCAAGAVVYALRP